MKKNIFFVLIMLFVSAAFSQSYNWDNRFILTNSPDNIIYCQTIYNGYVVAGGQFTTVAGNTANCIALWDGTNWQTIGNGFNGKVLALEVFQNQIVAGGEFTQSGTTNINYLAYWDGNTWTELVSGTNGFVHALNAWDLRLFVGGNFDTVGAATAANNIAFYEFSAGWTAMGTGTNNTVNTIDFFNSSVVIGGDFTMASGDTVNYLAISDVFNNWNTIGTGADQPVYSLHAANSSSLYIGGAFTTVDGNTSNNLILRKDTSWVTFGTNINDTVFALADDTGIVYIGGAFTQANGLNANHICSWDGVNFDTLSSGLNGTAYSLATLNKDIYVGGNFTTAGTNESNFFAIWGIQPFLQTQSANQILCIGDSLNLYCNYYTTTTISYQWYQNNTAITGATDSSYSVISTTLSDTGTYYCIATNLYGADTCIAISVVINMPPAITTDPISTTICQNDSVQFSVSNSGSSPFTYQWQLDGSNILGATSNPLIIYLTDTADAGQYRCEVSNSCGTTYSESAILTVNLLPQVNFTGLDSNYCNNNSADTLTGIPSGGVFSGNGISGSIFNPTSLSGPQPITYSFTDTNGCSNQITYFAQVNVVQPLDFSGLDTNYCYSHGSDTLTPSISGGTFSGNGIFNDSLFDPLTVLGFDTITYSLNDTNNCLATTTHVTYVFQEPPITFNSVDSVYCYGNPVDSIWATPTGGIYTGLTGNYFYSDSIGTFTVTYTVTQDGCSGTDSVEITVHPSPTATFTGLDSIYCANTSSVVLTGTPSSGLFYGSGIIDSTFYPTQADTGQIQLIYVYIDSIGCSAADTQTTHILPTQVVTFYPLDTAYCINQNSVDLYGYPTGGTFFGDGITDTIFDPQTAGIGTHEIIYTWLNTNGCLSTDTQTTEIFNAPDISIEDTVGVCYGDTTELTIINNDTSTTLTYVWSTIDTTQSIFVSPTHDFTYSVTVTSGICQVLQSVFVPVYATPMLNLDNTYNLCRKDTIFSGVNYPSYLWIPYNTTDSFFVVLNTGSLYLSVTDSNGCQNSDTTFVTLKPSPIVNLEDELTIAQGNPVVIGTGNNFDSYLWSTGDTTYYIVFYSDSLTVGNYDIWLSAQNDNGCWDSDTITIHIIPSMGITDYENPFNLTVFPNPSNGNFNISLENLNYQDVSIQITDIKGKIIYENLVKNSLEFNKKITLTNFNSSLYL
ncbi:MAG: immunoglobulin domain-containing protein, partial [Bacteroidales bacterium]|nr:immunoglobulin domain-containing protein [Bacteroidales bacterium]